MSHAEKPFSQWQGIVQVGTGQIEKTIGIVVDPKLQWSRGGWQLDLRGQMRFAWRDGALGWATDWGRPETYAAMLEQFSFVSANGRLQARLEALHHKTLGLGILMQRYATDLDPWHLPGPGVSVQGFNQIVQWEVVLDRIVSPAVMGAYVGWRPLKQFGLDPQGRLRLGLETVLDVRAPDSAPGKEVVVGGSALEASYVVWQRPGLRLALFGAASVLLRPAFGGHFGMRLDSAEAETTRWDVRLEAVYGGKNFQPWYFDSAYAWERAASPWVAGQRKAAIETPDGFWAECSGAWQNRILHMHAMLRMDHTLALQSTIGARWTRGPAVVGLTWMERALYKPGAWSFFGETAMFSMETAWRWRGGFFQFTQARLGPSIDGNAVTQTEWSGIAGIGYGGVL